LGHLVAQFQHSAEPLEDQPELLSQAIDDQVEAFVSSSQVVRSLSELADAQSQAISSLQAARATLQAHALRPIQPPSVPVGSEAQVQGGPATSAEAQVQSDTATSAAAQVQDDPSTCNPDPSPLTAIYSLDAQIAALSKQLSSTVHSRESAVVEARQLARLQMVAQLSPKEQRLLAAKLPSGPMDRFLRRVSHEDHMALLWRSTPLSNQPATQPPATKRDPIIVVVMRLSQRRHVRNPQHLPPLFALQQRLHMYSRIHRASNPLIPGASSVIAVAMTRRSDMQLGMTTL
jgi:hypothetical protein